MNKINILVVVFRAISIGALIALGAVSVLGIKSKNEGNNSKDSKKIE